MITKILTVLRPELTQEQLGKFETYYRMLTDWNERVNLTAITEPEDVAKKHFIDSLAAAPYLPQGARGGRRHRRRISRVTAAHRTPRFEAYADGQPAKAADVFGSGAGRTWDQGRVRAFSRRRRGRDQRYREKFDVALSRAVSALRCLQR